MIFDNKHWLPEENGNAGKWMKDINVRNEVLEILTHARYRLYKEKKARSLREDKVRIGNINRKL